MDGAQPSFYEPGGLSVANGKLYVADTNNQAVRVVDLETRAATTLKLKGLQPPAANAGPDETEANAAAAAPDAGEIKLAPQRVRAQAEAALVVDVQLPAGHHLNSAAPQRYKISVEGDASLLALAKGTNGAAASGKLAQLPLRLPLRTGRAGASTLRIALTLYYCREDNTGTCRIQTLAWRVPVEVTGEATAPREIKASGEIKLQ
jgi:hypothetical protein